MLDENNRSDDIRSDPDFENDDADYFTKTNNTGREIEDTSEISDT
jgi:hypothetical protein